MPVLALIFGLFYCQARSQIQEIFTRKDLTPPQVTFITPADSETEVRDKPTNVIGFNEPMNAAPLNSATVIMKSANGTPAVGSYEYDEAQNVLSIRIVQNLFVNTQYTITLTDKVRDRAGNPQAALTSHFWTHVCPKSMAAKPGFNGSTLSVAKSGCTLYVGGFYPGRSSLGLWYSPHCDWGKSDGVFL
ncbi:MAG: Ig-like domain-containing protein [Leptospiraceae bacterium]|nr:Ig-like domain-containing protein [Leptospiraceae bacterium]